MKCWSNFEFDRVGHFGDGRRRCWRRCLLLSGDRAMDPRRHRRHRYARGHRGFGVGLRIRGDFRVRRGFFEGEAPCTRRRGPAHVCFVYIWL